MRRAAAVLVLLVVALAGCAAGATDSAEKPGDVANPNATSTPDKETPAAGGPYLPCELLTQAMAETAMAHPSTPGEAMTEGDISFCTYKATSGPNYEFSFAGLTVYPTKASLDENTSFYDLTEVDGVAEWAALSVFNSTIAVADGDLYMKISLSAARICSSTSRTGHRSKAHCPNRRMRLTQRKAAVGVRHDVACLDEIVAVPPNCGRAQGRRGSGRGRR